MLVLLVDDEPVIRQMVRRMLHQAGHEVVEGANGQEGLQRLEALAVELVLTDIVMPVMNGIEFIKQARLLPPSLVMIAMSGGVGPTISTICRRSARMAQAPPCTSHSALPTTPGDCPGFEGTLAQNA
jgi:CheY-like chemotaxis protein